MNITSNLYNHPYVTMAATSTLNPYNLWYIIVGSLLKRQMQYGKTKTFRLYFLNGELDTTNDGLFATSTPPEAFDILGNKDRPFTWRTTLLADPTKATAHAYAHMVGYHFNLGVYTPEFPADYFREAGSFVNVSMTGTVAYKIATDSATFHTTINCYMSWVSTSPTKGGAGIWNTYGTASIPVADATLLPATITYGAGIATISFNDKVFIPKQDFEILTHSPTVRNPCSRLCLWFDMFNHNLGNHDFSLIDLMIQVIPAASLMDIAHNGEI